MTRISIYKDIMDNCCNCENSVEDLKNQIMVEPMEDTTHIVK